MVKTLLALALLCSASAVIVSPDLGEWTVREQFQEFEAKFTKVYDSVEQREGKFLTFAQNLEDVVSKNAKLVENGEDAIHGVTKFSDMTTEEFRSKMLNSNIASPIKSNATVAVPTKQLRVTKKDWRDSLSVTGVKSQGQCSSSWAQVAVQSIESMYVIQKNRGLTAFSTQQLTSCATKDNGCNGGWYIAAWEDYIDSAGGLTTEADYPYDEATFNGVASPCKSGLVMVPDTIPFMYMWSTDPCYSMSSCDAQDEDKLRSSLLQYGPVAIEIDASAFNLYRGGVMTSASCKSGGFDFNHAAQIVGFNEEAEQPYWIVRNSWGTHWGDRGYLYMKMGDNTCGLANRAANVFLPWE